MMRSSMYLSALAVCVGVRHWYSHGKRECFREQGCAGQQLWSR